MHMQNNNVIDASIHIIYARARVCVCVRVCVVCVRACESDITEFLFLFQVSFNFST